MLSSRTRSLHASAKLKLYDHWAELKWRSLYILIGLLVAGYCSFICGDCLIKLSWVGVNLYLIEVAYNNFISTLTTYVPYSSSILSSMYKGPEVMDLSVEQLSTLLSQRADLNVDSLIYTDITEGLWCRLWVAGYVSLNLSVPLILYHTYTFIKPGLWRSEAKVVLKLIMAFLLLLTIAHILSFTLILPRASSYLLNFQSGAAGSSDSSTSFVSWLRGSFDQNASFRELNLSSNFDIEYLGKLNSWVEFTLGVNQCVVMALELPLLLFVGAGAYLKLTAQSVLVYLTPFARKLLLFFLTVLAAISSPPDVISLFLVLLPLVVIIEVAVVYIIYLELSSRRV